MLTLIDIIRKLDGQPFDLCGLCQVSAGVGNPGPGEPQGVLAFVVTQ